MSLTGACTSSETNYTKQPGVSTQTESVAKQTYNTPEVMNKMTFKQHLEMYWEFFFEKGEKFPPTQLPQQQVKVSELSEDKQDVLKVSWLGHSSLLINIDGHLVLTDPIFENKVSIVGPTRFNSALPLQIDAIPFVDVVIISHDHYDHLNKFSIQQLSDKTGIFVVPLGVGKRLVKWGISESKITEFNWWDEKSPKNDLTIAATPVQHFTGRGLFDRNSTLAASWVIKTPNHIIFFSGDSGYFDGFKEIGNKYGPFDMTFLECGAYNERWSAVHMFPEQTVQAHIDLKGKILQPIHWATFNLALHPWYEPMERFINAAWNKGVSVSTPVIGSVVDFHKPRTTDLWWLPAMEQSKRQITSNELASDLN